MADKLHFSLVSPARELFSGQVDHVIAPGTEGEFGVLVNHAPFMTTLKNGVVRVLEGDVVRHRFYVRGGFADVTPAGLTILAEEARNLSDASAQEIDVEVEAAKLKLLELDAGDTKRAVLEHQISYLEGLRSALAN
ncbi:ATP synthase F1, epsilon subunit [Hyphomonas neptunium ATCC 15444]|uniref:ATP synthase epsilon chain n=2 Tax=Hyphomonas TaxID=85 RepID=ATPE_HYPNA|nr:MULTISPECIES: F0F1 ATP synthase subunit epsilon [Hyphomonas]Q0C101.1 RecName: Full=ATP synthase epsilon chain; AltName: Full=ATP synthase F1 sector epsilon subunit; AltName: Full=F-ATPase epsilon subunit [Hyphomonas neptunium ATCC 15444]ABI76386.1 ATP synthase F1, epsilon subunit [Hyphomonas neptunium ATCC 15444]KCZ94993.1 ATP synthase F1 subunit epsilon [Hyphomonas hirschiana VP5]